PKIAPFILAFPLGLFAIDVVTVDSAACQRAARTAQDRTKRLGTARSDHIAQNPARQSTHDCASSAVITLAIIAAVTVAVDAVIVAKPTVMPLPVTAVAAMAGAII